MAPHIIRRDGIAAAQDGDFVRARDLLDAAAELLPDDVHVWLWRAVSAESAATAIPMLRRAIELDNGHALARRALARLLMAEGRDAAAAGQADVATDRLLEASRLEPELEPVWVALADVTTDLAAQTSHLRRAFELSASSEVGGRLHTSLVRHGVQLAKVGERSAARDALLEAVSLNDRDARVWLALGQLTDQPADAVSPLERALALAPGQPTVIAALKATLTTIAAEQRAANRPADARALLERALSLDDADVELWIAIAPVSPPVDALRALRRAQGLPLDEHLLQAYAVAAVDVARALAEIDRAEARALLRDATIRCPRLEPAWLALAALEPDAGAQREVLESATAHHPASGAIRDMLERLPRAEASRTIMIVDDSATVRKVLSVTLESSGYRVLAEPDGESAIATLCDEVPDLIFLDITMPKMDGYEVCRLVKKSPRTANVPVVMLSGKDGFFDKVRGRVAGATEYITKPFDAGAVLAAVAAHCK